MNYSTSELGNKNIELMWYLLLFEKTWGKQKRKKKNIFFSFKNFGPKSKEKLKIHYKEIKIEKTESSKFSLNCKKCSIKWNGD